MKVRPPDASPPGNDVLDDLFHGCAFVAFVEQSVIEKRSPDPEATRLRAFRLYEEALAEKNRRPEPSTDRERSVDMARMLR